MTKEHKRMKNDVTETINKIKETRMNLSKGTIEKKANEAGKSTEEYSKDEFDKLEVFLSERSKKLSSRISNHKRKAKNKENEISEEIKKIHMIVRNERREFTGGYIEDRTLHALKNAEKKFMKIIRKLEEEMELDSDLNLMRDLK